MLTQEDLQAIGTVIDQRIDAKVAPLIDQKLKPIKNDIRKIKKDVSVLIKHFDEADVRLVRRVTRIEKHLGLPALQP